MHLIQAADISAVIDIHEARKRKHLLPATLLGTAIVPQQGGMTSLLDYAHPETPAQLIPRPTLLVAQRAPHRAFRVSTRGSQVKALPAAALHLSGHFLGNFDGPTLSISLVRKDRMTARANRGPRDTIPPNGIGMTAWRAEHLPGMPIWENLSEKETASWVSPAECDEIVECRGMKLQL